jgi:hypothetical protein
MYVNYTIVCVGMIKGYNKSQQTSRWTKSKDIISHNKHQGERNQRISSVTTNIKVNEIKGYNQSQQTSRWTISKDIISHNKHQGERNQRI